jgi:hypothetical protein
LNAAALVSFSVTSSLQQPGGDVSSSNRNISARLQQPVAARSSVVLSLWTSSDQDLVSRSCRDNLPCRSCYNYCVCPWPTCAFLSRCSRCSELPVHASPQHQAQPAAQHNTIQQCLPANSNRKLAVIEQRISAAFMSSQTCGTVHRLNLGDNAAKRTHCLHGLQNATDHTTHTNNGLSGTFRLVFTPHLETSISAICSLPAGVAPSLRSAAAAAQQLA